MKFTRYFFATRQRADRKDISLAWIEQVLAQPVRREVQKDGRVRVWGPILESDGRYLRVVLLEDGETVHNAFFDPNFRL